MPGPGAQNVAHVRPMPQLTKNVPTKNATQSASGTAVLKNPSQLYQMVGVEINGVHKKVMVPVSAAGYTPTTASAASGTSAGSIQVSRSSATSLHANQPVYAMQMPTPRSTMAVSSLLQNSTMPNMRSLKSVVPAHLKTKTTMSPSNNTIAPSQHQTLFYLNTPTSNPEITQVCNVQTTSKSTQALSHCILTSTSEGQQQLIVFPAYTASTVGAETVATYGRPFPPSAFPPSGTALPVTGRPSGLPSAVPKHPSSSAISGCFVGNQLVLENAELCSSKKRLSTTIEILDTPASSSTSVSPKSNGLKSETVFSLNKNKQAGNSQPEIIEIKPDSDEDTDSDDSIETSAESSFSMTEATSSCLQTNARNANIPLTFSSTLTTMLSSGSKNTSKPSLKSLLTTNVGNSQSTNSKVNTVVTKPIAVNGPSVFRKHMTARKSTAKPARKHVKKCRTFRRKPFENVTLNVGKVGRTATITSFSMLRKYFPQIRKCEVKLESPNESPLKDILSSLTEDMSCTSVEPKKEFSIFGQRHQPKCDYTSSSCYARSSQEQTMVSLMDSNRERQNVIVTSTGNQTVMATTGQMNKVPTSTIPQKSTAGQSQIYSADGQNVLVTRTGNKTVISGKEKDKFLMIKTYAGTFLVPVNNSDSKASGVVSGVGSAESNANMRILPPISPVHANTLQMPKSIMASASFTANPSTSVAPLTQATFIPPSAPLTQATFIPPSAPLTQATFIPPSARLTQATFIPPSAPVTQAPITPQSPSEPVTPKRILSIRKIRKVPIHMDLSSASPCSTLQHRVTVKEEPKRQYPGDVDDESFPPSPPRKKLPKTIPVADDQFAEAKAKAKTVGGGPKESSSDRIRKLKGRLQRQQEEAEKARLVIAGSRDVLDAMEDMD